MASQVSDNVRLCQSWWLAIVLSLQLHRPLWRRVSFSMSPIQYRYHIILYYIYICIICVYIYICIIYVYIYMYIYIYVYIYMLQCDITKWCRSSDICHMIFIVFSRRIWSNQCHIPSTSSSRISSNGHPWPSKQWLHHSCRGYIISIISHLVVISTILYVAIPLNDHSTPK